MSVANSNSASVELTGAVPQSQRRGKRIGPYSLCEMRALSELVTRTSNSLRNRPDPMTPEQYKQIWKDIANCMHVSGWPKRSWRRLRLKAQRLLTASIENGSCEQASGNHAAILFMDNATRLSKYSRTTLKNNATTTSTLCTSDPLSVSSSGTARPSPSPSVTFISTTVPPPLLSFSEASAGNVIKLTNSTRVSSSIASNSPGVMTTGPQILHVCSKAVTSSAGSTAECLSEQPLRVLTVPTPSVWPTGLSTVSVLEVENDESVNSHDRIDLCASSDEDDKDDFVAEQHSSRLQSSERISYSPTTAANTKNAICPIVDVRSSSPPPPPPPSSKYLDSLTEIDFRKRMEIYNLKLEVLKLKRDYWTKKLRAVSAVHFPTS